jgi:hypothetical protein
VNEGRFTKHKQTLQVKYNFIPIKINIFPERKGLSVGVVRKVGGLKWNEDQDSMSNALCFYFTITE